MSSNATDPVSTKVIERGAAPTDGTANANATATASRESTSSAGHRTLSFKGGSTDFTNGVLAPEVLETLTIDPGVDGVGSGSRAEKSLYPRIEPNHPTNVQHDSASSTNNIAGPGSTPPPGGLVGKRSTSCVSPKVNSSDNTVMHSPFGEISLNRDELYHYQSVLRAIPSCGQGDGPDATTWRSSHPHGLKRQSPYGDENESGRLDDELGAATHEPCLHPQYVKKFLYRSGVSIALVDMIVDNLTYDTRTRTYADVNCFVFVVACKIIAIVQHTHTHAGAGHGMNAEAVSQLISANTHLRSYAKFGIVIGNDTSAHHHHSDVAFGALDELLSHTGGGVGDNGMDGHQVRARRRSSTSPVGSLIRVRVCSPTLVEMPGSNFVSYMVNTFTGIPWYPGSRITVHRRYRDFQWLDARVRKVYHGILLPTLPPKRYINNNDDDFVHERMEWLNLYIKCVVQHPRLLYSFELEAFLSASPSQLEHAKRLMPVAGLAAAPTAGSTASSTTTRREDHGGTTATATAAATSIAGSLYSYAGLGLNMVGITASNTGIDTDTVMKKAGGVVDYVGASVKPGSQYVASLWSFARKSVSSLASPEPLQTPSTTEFIELSATRCARQQPLGDLLARAESYHHAKRAVLEATSASAISFKKAAETFRLASNIGHSHGRASLGDVDFTMSLLLDQLGASMERLFDNQIDSLNSELEPLIHLRVQKGLLEGEQQVVTSRELAASSAQSADSQCEQATRRLQAVKASSRGASHKLTAAEDSVNKAMVERSMAYARLEAITSGYEGETKWSDTLRREGLAVFLAKFVQLQRQQAQENAEAFREVLDIVKPTESDMAQSREHLCQPLPTSVIDRISAQRGTSSMSNATSIYAMDDQGPEDLNLVEGVCDPPLLHGGVLSDTSSNGEFAAVNFLGEDSDLKVDVDASFIHSARHSES